MSTAPVGIPPLWMNRLRPGLPPLPDRLANLPIDDRGYPVPFFVAWIDGKPDHRIADMRKRNRCITQELCWLCGDTLGRNRVFVLGPMGGVTMASSDAPCHLECARWAVTACPFLLNSGAKRRPVTPAVDVEIEEPGGVMITRNPGVTLLWTATNYWLEAQSRNDPKPLFRLLGPPKGIEAYTAGRPATFEETWASVESGRALLEEHEDDAGLRQLAGVLDRFKGQLRRFLPAAS